MQNLCRFVSRLSTHSLNSGKILKEKRVGNTSLSIGSRAFSIKSVGGRGGGDWNNVASGGGTGDTASGDLGWDTVSSWSTGLTKDHFDGQSTSREAGSSGDGGGNSYHSALVSNLQDFEDRVKEFGAENKKSEAFVRGWGDRMREISVLLKQVKEPGARGSYLKDIEKAEMYRLHKENPEVYTVEKLAKDYRIMRQRVHAILWLKELEEEEEKKLGHKLDDSVEVLLDNFPEFFISHDREFHVASLPYKPDFKIMPEGWDGTARDLDEVHYEISKKEDEMLYQDFVQRMNFNKKKKTLTSVEDGKGT